MDPDHHALARQLEARIEAQAAEYAADPSKGRDDGYWPERIYRPVLNGQSAGPLRVRSDRAAWLIAVAKRDLSDWRWRVIEGVAGAAELAISDRRSDGG
jgi:hypothetical protein